MALQPLRVAAKFDPPTFAVEVEAMEDIEPLQLKEGSRAHLTYNLKRLDENTCSKALSGKILSKLKAKGVLFESEPVAEEKLVKTISEIIRNFHALNALKTKIDLNKLDNETLETVKNHMDKDFEKKRLRPADEGYAYDKSIDFCDQISDGENSWDD